ncbi:hypothetical protein VPNG_07887 [Cytospora leucostoma]|uniref:DUF866 domain protein n=1 Tax=Cytospora leucostoma TaxID=1230097 RepID=A0A423WGV0_9PEZI|nr:hypothetical protein VPNG_07887 [Cytospora leucostoma]
MYALNLQAELGGMASVTNLRPDDTEGNPFWYTFKVQCTSCRETHQNWVGVSRFRSRRAQWKSLGGNTTFVGNTDICVQREASASIKAAPSSYEQSEPAKPKNILEFDCRGLEFVEFRPDGQWLAEGLESGTKFTEIDLSEGEWFDYDEKAGDEVSINDIKWEIKRS